MITMNAIQRKQFKRVRKQMIDKDLTTGKIADDLGVRRDVISQLINGLYYYPRHAEAIRQRYGIVIPDTRKPRHQRVKAA